MHINRGLEYFPCQQTHHEWGGGGGEVVGGGEVRRAGEVV